MSTRTVKGNLRCDSDCAPGGCPGHVMEVSHNDTSETFHARVDGNTVFIGDDSGARLLVELIGAVDPYGHNGDCPGCPFCVSLRAPSDFS